jgi:isocitrate dehydrogenase (NAD+)
VEWAVSQVGAQAASRHGGNPLPDDVIHALKTTRVGLKGPLTTDIKSAVRSVNIALRRSLDLYAQVRPCKGYPGAPSRYRNVDLLVIRETTEDLYAGIEFERRTEDALAFGAWLRAKGFEGIDSSSGFSVKPISEAGARRIFEFAFSYARAHGRKRLTCVHKAAVMRHTDGLFLETAREVAAKNPEVEFDDRAVDTLAGELVRQPESFDVLVMPNLYGDIISDLAAGLIGGVGLAPGGNFGDDTALFEPAHGSAPKYAGLNKVNPSATILSSAMMLRQLGYRDAADRVEAAVAGVIEDGEFVTYDLKDDRDDPTAFGTREMTDAIIAKLRS